MRRLLVYYPQHISDRMPELTSILLKCPITSVCSLDWKGVTSILVGQGSYVYLCQNGAVHQRLRIFQASAVHSIKSFNDRILVTGGKSVATLECCPASGELKLRDRETCMQDWLWDALWSGDHYYFLTAHNRVVVTDARLRPETVLTCREKCILYSGFLHPARLAGVLVLAGSVFSQILVWDTTTCTDEARVLHRYVIILSSVSVKI